MTDTTVATLCFVLIGWFITHLFSEARERRKELRTNIDKLHDAIYKIEKDGVSFHCATEFSEDLNDDVILQMAIIERKLSRIIKSSDLAGNIIRLRRSITLENFDKTGFTRQPRRSNIVYSISSACQDIEDELEAAYRRKYPDRFPYFTWF